MLSLTALAVCAGGAAAQQSSTLIGNTGQTSGTDKWSDRDHSQAFTTGAASSGYNITAVEFDFSINNPSGTTEPTFEVRIQAADAQGRPTGASLGTFEPSGSLVEGVNTLSVTGSPIHLDPNTKYALVLDFVSRGDKDVRVRWTTSNNADSNTQSGWSIEINGLSRTFNTNNAFSMIGGETDSVKFSISGYAGTAVRSVYELLGDYFSGTGTLSDVNTALQASGQTYYQKLLEEVDAGRLDDRVPGPESAWGDPGTEDWAQMGHGFPKQFCYQFQGETRCIEDTSETWGWGSQYSCGGRPQPGLHSNDFGDFFWACTGDGQWVPVRRPRPGVDYARDDQLIRPGQSGYNDKCLYRDEDGNPAPAHRYNGDGTWTTIRGANYDPIEGSCRGSG